MLQNFTLFTSDQTKKKYPNFSKRMAAVSGGARDARVSFSCFKLLKDITLLNDIYKNYKPTPKTSSALALFDACLIGSHFIYAIFENSTFYNRIGATKKDRSDTYGKLFNFFWTVYIVIAVNKKLYELKHFIPSITLSLTFKAVSPQINSCQSTLLYIGITFLLSNGT